ncbi:MAG: hypothetical protein K0U93_18400 [Gammaproteobacteria bacterium]|nr:hypothetical protein [Gammaproteobacteria bacterium]
MSITAELDSASAMQSGELAARHTAKLLYHIPVVALIRHLALAIVPTRLGNIGQPRLAKGGSEAQTLPFSEMARPREHHEHRRPDASFDDRREFLYPS